MNTLDGRLRVDDKFFSNILINILKFSIFYFIYNINLITKLTYICIKFYLLFATVAVITNN